MSGSRPSSRLGSLFKMDPKWERSTKLGLLRTLLFLDATFCLGNFLFSFFSVSSPFESISALWLCRHLPTACNGRRAGVCLCKCRVSSDVENLNKDKTKAQPFKKNERLDDRHQHIEACQSVDYCTLCSSVRPPPPLPWRTTKKGKSQQVLSTIFVNALHGGPRGRASATNGRHRH